MNDVRMGNNDIHDVDNSRRRHDEDSGHHIEDNGLRGSNYCLDNTGFVDSMRFQSYSKGDQRSAAKKKLSSVSC